MKNKEKNELISYAMDFASYIILKSRSVNRIILHGSAARADFNETSDVDLFVDSSDKKLNENMKKITEDYYKTAKFKEWRLKGIDNAFSVITGDLESSEWKDLKRAIVNTGIILYGKYKANVEKVNQYSVLSFENIQPNEKRVALFRKLFGFKTGKTEYKGEVEKARGIRIGKGVILIPSENLQRIKEHFGKKKVSFRIFDVWSDSRIS